MPERLEAEIELDVSAARSAVSDLGDEIERQLATAVESFSTEFGRAADSLPTVEPEVDAATVTSDLTAAVEAADGTVVTPEVESGAVTEGLIGAVEAADGASFVADADTTDIAPAIQAAVDLAQPDPLTVEVEADTTSAQEELVSLGDQAGAAGGGFDSLTNSTAGFAAAAGVAEGSASGLAGAIQDTGGSLGWAAAGAATAAGVIGLFFREALEAEAATYRFNNALGDMADRVSNLSDIQDLGYNLGELALALGGDDDALRDVVATMYQTASAAGAGAEASAKFTEQVVALAARSVALNPSLGSVDTVARQLTISLVRGGFRLNRYGLDLSAADISARALANTHKATAKELTFTEKAMAGAQLATEKYGASIKDAIGQGVENPTIKLRVLKQSVLETAEALGANLVAPIFELLQAGLPAVEAVGTVFGELAESAIPTLTVAVQALVPVLEVVGGVFRLLGPVLGPLITAWAAFKIANLTLAPALGLVSTGLERMPLGFIKSGAAAESAAGKLNTASERVGQFANAAPALATGALLAANGVQSIGTSAQGTVTGILSMTAAGAAMGSVIPGVGTAVGAAAGTVAGFGVAMLKTADSAETFAKRIGETAEELNKLGAQKAAQAFLENLNDQMPGLAGNFAAVRAAIFALGTESPATAERVTKGLTEMGSASGFTSAQLTILGDTTAKATTKAQAHAAHAKEAADRNTELGQSATGTAKAFQPQIDVMARATEAVAGLNAAYGNLSRTITQSVSETVPAVGAVFDAFESKASSTDPAAFVDNLNSTTQGVTDWISTVQSLMDQGLVGLAALVSSQGPEIGGKLAAGIASATPETVAAWNEQIVAGAVALAQAQADATIQGAAIGHAIAEGVKVSGPEFVAALQQNLADMESFNANMQALSSAGMMGLINVINSAAPELRAPLAREFAQMPVDAQSQLNLTATNTLVGMNQTKANIDTVSAQAAADFNTTVGQLPTFAAQHMAGAKDAVAAGGPGVAGAAGAAGTGGAWSFGGGFSVAQGFAGSITASLGGIINQNASIVGSEARVAGLAIGSQLGGGMYDGIDMWAGRIEGVISEVVRRAEAAARKVAEISSPSKMFARIGAAMGEGMAVGLGDAGKAVVAEAESIVRAAAQATNRSLDVAALGRAPAPPAGSELLGARGYDPDVWQRINVDVQVNGVADEEQARRAGHAVGEGFAAGLRKRRTAVMIGSL